MILVLRTAAVVTKTEASVSAVMHDKQQQLQKSTGRLGLGLQSLHPGLSKWTLGLKQWFECLVTY